MLNREVVIEASAVRHLFAEWSEAGVAWVILD